MELSAKPYSFGFSIFIAKNNNVKLHGHRPLELAYVDSGAMENTINGEKQIVTAGHYFMVDHGITHSYKRISQEPLVVRNYLFYPRFLDRSLRDDSRFRDMMRSYLLRFCYQTLRSDPTGQTFSDEDGRIRALLEIIEQEYKAESYGYLEYIRCALVEVLILTARKIGQQPASGARSGVVRELKRFADANYTKPIKLRDGAAELGYSATYLSQKFSSEMGMSFTDYLHQLRLQHGCRLLEGTDLTVAQIAEQVGYDGAKYFTQIFKKQLATTPGKFRAAYKNA